MASSPGFSAFYVLRLRHSVDPTRAQRNRPLAAARRQADDDGKTGREEAMRGSKNPKTSRRRVLQAVGALIAGAAASQPPSASAQTDADLARLQGARRVLIKGGIVLTLDRQVGDFAQADVLIEDGRIREVR